jgi:Protein of unknown function (DUF3311)
MSHDPPASPTDPLASAAPVSRSDRSAWNLLLLVPITLPLLTFVYNRQTPMVLGFPFFFWFQLLFAPLAVAAGVCAFYLSRRSRPKRGW